VSLCE